MNIWAIVPAKDFSRAKTRLAGILDLRSRRELARFMLEHVLSVLERSRPEVAGSVIVTDSPEIGSLASRFGARAVYRSADGGLNEHVADAIADVATFADAAIVLMGDLPTVTSLDVRALVRELGEADVVVAPDGSGRQTNALGLWLDHRASTAFGRVGSLQAHCATAEQSGLRVRRVVSPTLAFDVDEPADYVRFGNMVDDRWKAQAQSRRLYRNRESLVSDR